LFTLTLRNHLAATPETPFSRRIDTPAFIISQWLSGQYRDNIVCRLLLEKNHTHIRIFQRRRTKRSATSNMCQLSAAKTKQPVAITHPTLDHACSSLLLAVCYAHWQKLLNTASFSATST